MLSTLSRLLGWMCLPAAVLLLSLWTFSRVATDRLLISQFLFWIPSLVLLLPALLLTAVSVLARRPRRDRSIPRVAVRATNALAGWLILAILHLAFIEYRAFNLVLPAGDADENRSIRIVHWNAAALDSRGATGHMSAYLPGRAPDFVFTATQQSHNDLLTSLAGFNTTYDLRRHGTFAIASRFPIIRSALFPMDLDPDGTSADVPFDPAKAQGLRRWMFELWNGTADSIGLPRREFNADDSASLLLVELDTTTRLGRPLVIWWVDLPSDPLLARWETAGRYRQRLDALCRLLDPRTGKPVLPPPDVILGDFNTPRGSASLCRIVGDFAHAFDHAGAGPAATWPRARPVLHIDHLFLAPWLRAASYSIVRPPICDHCLQVADITAREPAAPPQR